MTDAVRERSLGEKNGDVDDEHMIKDGKRDDRPQWVRDYLAERDEGPVKRAQEIFYLLLSFSLMALHLQMLYQHFSLSNLPSMVLSIVLGITTADWIGGTIHWAADTWGSVNAPVGKSFIRMLRAHHYDPMELTTHDFITINGDSFSYAMPFLFPSLRHYFFSSPTDIAAAYNWICYLFVVAVFFGLTGQFHIWAHMYRGLPPFVGLLQRLHIIIPRHLHANHHHHPKRHASYFCLTSGWLNYPFEYFGYWDKLEYIIEYISGHKPRSADYYE